MYSRLVGTANHAGRIVGAVVLLALLAACSKPPVVEEYAPKLALVGLDGKQTSLQAFQGKLLVLNVWASWCGPCRREMPSLDRLSRTVDSKRIVVIALAADQDVNAVREFLFQQRIELSCFIDTPRNVADSLGVRGYPETLLIAPDGKIVQRIRGERDWSSQVMLRVLEEAYQGRRSEPDDKWNKRD